MSLYRDLLTCCEGYGFVSEHVKELLEAVETAMDEQPEEDE